MKDHERGDIPKVDWLDRLAFRQIEQVHQRESAISDRLYLYVDLPRFDFPVVFSEQVSHVLVENTVLMSRKDKSPNHLYPYYHRRIRLLPFLAYRPTCSRQILTSGGHMIPMPGVKIQ